jgi:hypothetical protein
MVSAATLGEGINYRFCTTCGSTVCFAFDTRPIVAIPVGTFGDPDFRPPDIEVHVRTRHRWLSPIATAAQFEDTLPEA